MPSQSPAATLSAEHGLTRYLARIREFPMLSAEDEYMLASRRREHQDLAAAERLTTSHLRLVAKLAMGYRGYGLPIGDLIAEGNIGLIQAIHRFEPERGFRLSTYATWWIRAAIQESILRSYSLVKMGTTSNQKKLFFGLRRAKAEISALEEGDLRPENVDLIAKKLRVPPAEVVEMNRRLAGDGWLNASASDEAGNEWQDRLVDDGPSAESVVMGKEEAQSRGAALARALQGLNDRERTILVARQLQDEPVKLETLAERYGVSRERIRQIELRAFAKIQQAVLESRPNQQPVNHIALSAAKNLRAPAAGVSLSLAA